MFLVDVVNEGILSIDQREMIMNVMVYFTQSSSSKPTIVGTTAPKILKNKGTFREGKENTEIVRTKILIPDFKSSLRYTHEKRFIYR